MMRLVDALYDVVSCPLCGGDQSDGASRPLPNLYSEQVALETGCDESVLLDAVGNRRCATCGLWYKARWFRPSILQALFSERVPDHPKGWDVVSDRFSEDGFARELESYRHAIEAGSVAHRARCRRTLSSIVDSMVGIEQGLRQRLLQGIEDGDVAMLESLRSQLLGQFEAPAPFKRFSGFSSGALWAWMESHVGTVTRYGEVGCPLWGQLARPADATERYYFQRPEANYWGSGCRRGGEHCSQRLARRGDVAVRSWPPGEDLQLDVLGAFQYLDHLKTPGTFVTEAFNSARALLLIMDGGHAPSSVQHFTGWGDCSVGWLAQTHGKRVVADFRPIESSGNLAWLLLDD